MYCAGVDVGSTTTKAAILDANRALLGTSLLATGADVTLAGQRAFDRAVEAADIEPHEVTVIIGTGYGRYKVTFGHAQITEISCHAKGASFLFPNTRTLLDIGGQDTKAIRLGQGGEVIEFVMNDKCAAGTGRFLDASAQVLDIPLHELGPTGLRARAPIKLSNVCTVFVESEILSHTARGRPTEDIVGGVHKAIASRSVALLRRVGIEEEITFTGGVSKNIGMQRAIEEALGTTLNVSELSQHMGAIGAALFALERSEGEKTPIGGQVNA